MNFFQTTLVLSSMKGGKMQDISALIQEAKPLYFTRKKRRNQMKIGATMMLCVGLLLTVFWPGVQNDGSYIWETGYNEVETASYVENLGLPVDDYGLLLVG